MVLRQRLPCKSLKIDSIARWTLRRKYSTGNAFILFYFFSKLIKMDLLAGGPPAGFSFDSVAANVGKALQVGGGKGRNISIVSVIVRT